MEICISIFLGILSCIYLAWSRWFLSYLFNNFELGLSFIWGFSGGSDGKESACDEGNPASIPGSGRSHGERHGNPSRNLAWRISRTEEPGGLQSMRLQRAGHNWASNTFTFKFYSVFYSSWNTSGISFASRLFYVVLPLPGTAHPYYPFGT